MKWELKENNWSNEGNDLIDSVSKPRYYINIVSRFRFELIWCENAM